MTGFDQILLILSLCPSFFIVIMFLYIGTVKDKLLDNQFKYFSILSTQLDTIYKKVAIPTRKKR